MGTDWLGEWDGICACGRAEMDGVKCFLGATHKPLLVMPWATPSTAKEAPSPAA